MAKTGRLTGPSKIQGDQPEPVTTIVGDVHVVGPDADLTVAGDGSFGGSPLVPNPASLNPSAATSIGEVEQLIAESSAGFIRSMEPKSTIVPFLDNTTAEQSMLLSSFTMPRLSYQAVFRMMAAGALRNVSGSPATLTWRLRNLTDGTIVCAVAVSVPNDTQARIWKWEVSGEGNTFIGDVIASDGDVKVGAGASAAFTQAMGTGSIALGSDPQEWDLTVQSAVAHADIEATARSAQILYALPGA